jgi:signal peptidase I
MAVSNIRKPWLAVLLSFLFPASGYWYCGKFARGILVYLLAVAGANLAVALLVFSDIKPMNVAGCVLLCIAIQLIVLIDAYRTAKATQENPVSPIFGKWYLHSAAILMGGVLSFYVTPVFGNYEGFKIPTSGMENTIMINDHILADLSAYDTDDPQTNDLVIFRFPPKPDQNFIQRCIAGPGQTVELVNKIVYVDNRPIDDPEFSKHTDPGAQEPGSGGSPRDNFGPLKVPDGHYFMLGDNRDHSYDSRFWGTVPRELIMAKALRVYLSSDFDRIGLTLR